MVVINLKRGEESAFCYETTVNIEMPQLINQLVELYNDYKRLDRLINATEDLILYGPEKPEMEKGYTEEQLDEIANNKPSQKVSVEMNGFTFYKVTCPTGTRVGLECGPEAAACIKSTLEQAKQIKQLKTLTRDDLKKQFDNISAAITIVYPQGLPLHDPTRAALDNTEDLEGTQASKDVFVPGETSLWWAGKELKSNTLASYVGKNDKTKIMVKIQKAGQGQPIREPTISEQEQKNLMAYYYRKEQENKELLENEEDDYLHSTWADPKSLKRAFNGMRDVKFNLK
ncbi:hypothetical protein HDV04_004241 [Boothiomyces sp. JEL0838]|nr:hypothetical protein HDV04_004241 [Boothiomyces sp. JEL0838]